MKLIDKILVAVIVLAAAFIGYRFLGGQKTTFVPANSPKPLVVVPGTNNLQDTIGDIPGRKHGSVQALTLSMKTSPSLEKYRVEKTSACQETLFAPIEAYPIYSAEVAAHVSGKANSLLLEGGTGCLTKNAQWVVYKVGAKSEESYFKDLGISRVVEIFEIPFAEFNEALAQSIGVSNENRSLVTNAPVFSKSNRVVLVNISKPSDRSGAKPPGSPPKYPVVGSEGLRAWFKQRGKETILIDVRSESEMAAEAIKLPAAIKRVPYKLSGAASFSWERTVGQIESDRFNATPDFASLVSFARGPGAKLHLVVVGSDSLDGRPIWAMKELGQFGITNVVWYRDGVKSLNATANE